MNALPAIKTTVRIGVFVLLLLAGLGYDLNAQTSAPTPQRIATVSARKLFDEYWKTIEANRMLGDNMRQDSAVMDRLVAEHRKLTGDLDALTNSAADPGISMDEQRKRRAAVEAKVTEVREFEKMANQTKTSLLQKMDEQKRRYREENLNDITGVIATIAKAGGYDLVFDVSGDSGNNQTPMLLFTSGKSDLTSQVLEALNKDAPKVSPSAISPAATSPNLAPRAPAPAPLATNPTNRGASASGSR